MVSAVIAAFVYLRVIVARHVRRGARAGRRGGRDRGARADPGRRHPGPGHRSDCRRPGRGGDRRGRHPARPGPEPSADAVPALVQVQRPSGAGPAPGRPPGRGPSPSGPRRSGHVVGLQTGAGSGAVTGSSSLPPPGAVPAPHARSWTRLGGAPAECRHVVLHRPNPEAIDAEPCPERQDPAVGRRQRGGARLGRHPAARDRPWPRRRRPRSRPTGRGGSRWPAPPGSPASSSPSCCWAASAVG